MKNKVLELLNNTQDSRYEIFLAYATMNNFTKTCIYKSGLQNTFLHAEALKRFNIALEQAAALGLRFKIWDAFRPVEAQQILWNHMPDEKYITHPQTGERPHCRGIALDLTLTDMQGTMLDMGTGFDDFSETAHQNFFKIPTQTQKNRLLLNGIMHAAGFVCNPFEWWHFQLPEFNRYKVLSNKEAPASML